MKEETLNEKEHELLETQMKKEHARKNFRAGVTQTTERIKKESEKIDEYVSSFGTLYGRRPMKDEIDNYMSTYMEEIVSKESLEKYLNEYNMDIV